MTEANQLLQNLNMEARSLFQERQVILSFSDFLKRVEEQPTRLVRNASQYLYDVFEFYGPSDLPPDNGYKRWKIFDVGTERHVPIVGGESVQHEINNVLSSFIRQGYSNKLIVLHGPNGSAKSSIIESLAHAMRRYSETEEGAVYRFNWIFPTDKTLSAKKMGISGPIGFAADSAKDDYNSFAYLDEARVASKIHSEFKENPLFLIPMPQREEWLRSWIAEERNVPRKT